MKTLVDNRSGVPLRIKDFYELPASSKGSKQRWLDHVRRFYGSTEFRVPPRGKELICSGEFFEDRGREECGAAPPYRKNLSCSGQLFAEYFLGWQRCDRQIHVVSGDEEVLLVLPHDVFRRNEGKDLILWRRGGGDRGLLGYEFVEPPTPVSVADRIRGMLSVLGLGSRSINADLEVPLLSRN